MATQSHYQVLLASFSEPFLSNSFPSGGPFSIPSDSSSDTTSHIEMIGQGRRNIRAQGESYRRDTTISTLPDNVLLEIFDLFREGNNSLDGLHFVWDWHFLVHVCPRWRQIIFDSPLRLNLQIFCTHGTPVRKNLGIWPAFPIVIDYQDPGTGVLSVDEDNVVAALEHPDRVSYLGLSVTGSQLGKMATVMQEPFPVLMYLCIASEGGNAPVLPAEFLGGSAPRLQIIELNGIPYPALPTLLLSTSDLVELHLFNIPPTSYFAPEAMIACLAVLPRLKSFVIEFQSATPRPDRICPPPITRTVLPALTFFEFKGASEYLEGLVSKIDSPQLDQIEINYLNQFIDFQVPQLSQFVDRSVGPKLTLIRHAGITFTRNYVLFEMYDPGTRTTLDQCPAWTSVLCQGIDWQVSHISQVLSHVSATLSYVVHLKLDVVGSYPEIVEGADDVEWPHLLHQFSTVQTLCVSRELSGHIAPALEDITGVTATGVLPSLDLICLVGQPVSSVEKFVTARRLSGRPVTIIKSYTEYAERLTSY